MKTINQYRYIRLLRRLNRSRMIKKYREHNKAEIIINITTIIKVIIPEYQEMEIDKVLQITIQLILIIIIINKIYKEMVVNQIINKIDFPSNQKINSNIQKVNKF